LHVADTEGGCQLVDPDDRRSASLNPGSKRSSPCGAFRRSTRLLTSQADDELTTRKPLSSRFSQARAIVSEDITIGHVKRRPAVVLFASYNRLQPGDEADSFVGLSLLRTEIIEPQIHKFGGRMIRWTGDEVLLEFE